MIYLNPQNPFLIKARRNHEDKLVPLLLDRMADVQTYCGKLFLDSFVKPRLKEILSGTPEEIFNINRQFNVSIYSDSEIHEAIKYVFNYDKWFVVKKKEMYDAYDLAKGLNAKTCVYCNRNYTSTVIKKKNQEKIIRPEFDHYFDQGNNPVLALSFYNLIPSCHICNSNLKHRTSFKLHSHIHPYSDDRIDDITFSFKYDLESPNGIKISVKSTCNRSNLTLEEFAIEDIYNSHSDIVYDLLKTRQAFSTRYLETLSNNFLSDIKVSQEELFRLVFGVEVNKGDFINRPMSKFKHDILKELGII